MQVNKDDLAETSVGSTLCVDYTSCLIGCLGIRDGSFIMLEEEEEEEEDFRIASAKCSTVLDSEKTAVTLFIGSFLI